jgi:hypothetical protein
MAAFHGSLRLAEHELGAGTVLELEPGTRVVYDVERDEAAYHAAAVRVEGPAHLLEFELVRGAAGRGRAWPLELDGDGEYLLRLDRVDFPPGGVAYRHVHQGPGVRVLLFGGIRIDTHGASTAHAPFGAWFETGPDPVFAATSDDEPSAFVRAMVLPRALLGQSSIRYVDPADAGKPRTQRYTVFVDQPVELP